MFEFVEFVVLVPRFPEVPVVPVAGPVVRAPELGRWVVPVCCGVCGCAAVPGWTVVPGCVVPAGATVVLGGVEPAGFVVLPDGVVPVGLVVVVGVEDPAGFAVEPATGGLVGRTAGHRVDRWGRAARGARHPVRARDRRSLGLQSEVGVHAAGRVCSGNRDAVGADRSRVPRGARSRGARLCSSLGIGAAGARFTDRAVAAGRAEDEGVARAHRLAWSRRWSRRGRHGRDFGLARGGFADGRRGRDRCDRNDVLSGNPRQTAVGLPVNEDAAVGHRRVPRDDGCLPAQLDAIQGPGGRGAGHRHADQKDECFFHHNGPSLAGSIPAGKPRYASSSGRRAPRSRRCAR